MNARFEDNALTDEGRTGTQMIHRCAKLLTLITTHNRLGMRLVDLYKAADLSRPTAHRILQALVTERLVRQDARSKKYYLGSLVYEMGLAAAPQFDLRDVSRPYLQRVAEATGDTVFLTIRSGFDGVCAARAEGAYPVKAFVTDVGRHRPLNVGGGAVALLSCLDVTRSSASTRPTRTVSTGTIPGSTQRPCGAISRMCARKGTSSMRCSKCRRSCRWPCRSATSTACR